MAKLQTGRRTVERARTWAIMGNIICEEFGMGNYRMSCVIEASDFGREPFVYTIGCGCSF